MPRRSLRNQIAAWFGGSLIGVVGCILLVLHFRIDAETRAQVVREMQNAERVLRYVMQAQAETLEARARSIGDLPKLGALLETEDQLTVQDVGREYPFLAQCDFVMLTNARGIVLAHTLERKWVGANVARQRGVEEALRGNAKVETRVEPRGVFQVASAPVRAGGVLTGTVNLGFALNDRFARRLRAASGAHLTFLAGDRISASSLAPDERAELLGSLGDRAGALRRGLLPASGGTPAVVLIRGQQYLTLARPLLDESGRAIGAYLIQKSVDDALQPVRDIQRALLAIGLTGLLLGMLASYLLARDITGPILRVVNAAEALGRGDWSQRVATSARDEVGVLAQTFNAMAARLQSWDADLRAAVAERTAELNQAVDRLDAAFTQMRRFNADASHELRTPLTIVRGEAEVALRLPRSAPEYERVLHSILEETEHMAHLIDGLLTLARADSGELKLEARPITLHDLLADLYQQAQVLAREKGIQVDFDCPPALLAHGDELRLRQLFLNLLDNAIKYTGPGGRVWLEAWEEKGQPVVRVRDTGIGVAPADLPHLFERFFRVDKARSREVGGSGLGLSICKWIVDAHGGTISVVSRPGDGTSFRVRLPAEEIGARPEGVTVFVRDRHPEREGTLNASRTLLWPAVALLAASFAAGCGSGRTLVAGNSTGGSNGTGGPSTQVTLSRDVQPVLTANCTGQGCHSGSGAQLGQDVSEGNAYNNLVNVKSVEVPELFRVKPGDSANSYVYQKLTQNPPQVGDPMPLGNFPLSPDKIEIIKRWIDGGALR